MKTPKWTIYGQKQEGKWMNTRHYFADTQEEAQNIYVRLKTEGYVSGYRPWTRDDLRFMGVLDRQEIEDTQSLTQAFRKSIDRSLFEWWAT